MIDVEALFSRGKTTATLEPIEIATSRVFGSDPTVPRVPDVPADMSTQAALEAAVLPAVARPPCVVTFSGGRDSSLVLAVAARVARREGLPDPIPATLRFVGVPEAEESRWQELVIRHLGVEEWVRRDVTKDVDLVGPLSARVLEAHGVVWPLNAYIHETCMDLARGGSVMTGMHGDAVFGGGRWLSSNDVLSGRRRPTIRDSLRLGLAFAPGSIRQRVFRRRARPLPWLRPAAQEVFLEAKARAEAAMPRRWDRWLEDYHRRRTVTVAHATVSLLAADVDALLVQPLADLKVLATMARAGGATGVGDRTAVMRALFTDLLPDELLARPDKAVFADAFVGRWTEEFVRDWRGDGVDTEIVDPEVLHRVWRDRPLDFRSALLLQSAWLHTRGSG